MILGPIAWGWRRQANLLVASTIGFGAMYGTMRGVSGAPGLVAGLVAGLAGLFLTASVLPVMAEQDADWALGLTGGRGGRLIARLGGLRLAG